MVLLPLAALLGVALISGEVSGGSIHLLLSKPVSRTRLLLTKYGVCAGVLLTAALLGGVVLFVAAVVRGYPSESLRFLGLALSAVLSWLALRPGRRAPRLDPLPERRLEHRSHRAGLVAGLRVPPGFLDGLLYTLPYDPDYSAAYKTDYGSVEKPTLLGLLGYRKLVLGPLGRSLAWVSFFVSPVAAALPLLAALWLLRRRAY